jgi:hypothetical protein
MALSGSIGRLGLESYHANQKLKGHLRPPVNGADIEVPEQCASIQSRNRKLMLDNEKFCCERNADERCTYLPKLRHLSEGPDRICGDVWLPPDLKSDRL